MSNIVVVKCGGSVLEDATGLARLAGFIRDLTEEGVRIVVVVSALKGVTDSLLGTVSKVNPSTPPDLTDEVLAMGERTAVRIFAAALLRHGLRARFLDPASPEWPIVTDDHYLDANPLVEETTRRVAERLVPLLHEGDVPVVCGFVGRTQDGRITTLGRGGSDTTAVLLGSCLDAREVLLVKDVEGVMSSDPQRVRDAEVLAALEPEQARVLAAGGAKFLHAKALRYRKPGVRIRIAGPDQGLAGTVIDGPEPELEVEVDDAPISMLSLVGPASADARTVMRVVEKVRESGGQLVSLTLDEQAMILYIRNGGKLLPGLHDAMRAEDLAHAISAFEDLAVVAVRGRALETSQGMIQRITQPLARRGINVYGLVTISSSIQIFVRRTDANRAAALIRAATMAS
jgi:aspartate kinase